MLEHTKKRPMGRHVLLTAHGGNMYQVPLSVMQRLEAYRLDRDTVSLDEAFSDLIEASSKPGICLKGLRRRERLSQKVLAGALNITQPNLSAMENGRREIGKAMAKKIANFLIRIQGYFCSEPI